MLSAEERLLWTTREIGLCALACTFCPRLYVASYAELVGAITRRARPTCPRCLGSFLADLQREGDQRDAQRAAQEREERRLKQEQARRSHHQVHPGAWMPQAHVDLPEDADDWDYWCIPEDELLPWERPSIRSA